MRTWFAALVHTEQSSKVATLANSTIHSDLASVQYNTLCERFRIQRGTHLSNYIYISTSHNYIPSVIAIVIIIELNITVTIVETHKTMHSKQFENKICRICKINKCLSKNLLNKKINIAIHR